MISTAERWLRFQPKKRFLETPVPELSPISTLILTRMDVSFRERPESHRRLTRWSGLAAVNKTSQKSEPVGLACRAEFIFNSRAGKDRARPIKVLSECMCDFRRPDWASRWGDWNSRGNPYLNLFLCAEHARSLGLME